MVLYVYVLMCLRVFMYMYVYDTYMLVYQFMLCIARDSLIVSFEKTFVTAMKATGLTLRWVTTKKQK